MTKKIEELNTFIDDKKIIEQAKQLLMKHNGFTDAQVQEYIFKKSCENKLKMKDVAVSLLISQ
jgi:AmiR/NasT family two-component response regulator